MHRGAPAPWQGGAVNQFSARPIARVNRPRRALVATAATLFAVAGCSGGSSDDNSDPPEDRLATAKASLDDAAFIDFELAADNLPGDVDGLTKATGTGTHAPAFTGEVDVKTALSFTAPVVSIDGVVYAQLPIVGWSEIDPADYGAPDPAALMDTDTGLSSLFTATEGPEVGDSERDGDEVFTTIDGTIPGDVVKSLFPSSGTDDFDVTYTVSADDDIKSIEVTGPFYDGSDDVTYTLTFDLDAAEVEIEAPI